MSSQQSIPEPMARRSGGARGHDRRRSVNLGDSFRLGETGPVATVVGLGSTGKAILAWREGCKFYEAAFNDFVRRVRNGD